MSELETTSGESRRALGQTQSEISAWITSYIARLLGRPEAAIDRVRNFNEIGLDSMMVIIMTEELGIWLHREIDPTSAYDHPTIEKFAAFVAQLK